MGQKRERFEMTTDKTVQQWLNKLYNVILIN